MTLAEGHVNSRCCAFALLLLISGSALATDSSLPPMSPAGLWLMTLGIVLLIAGLGTERWQVLSATPLRTGQSVRVGQCSCAICRP